MKKRTLPAELPKARNLEEAQLLIDELWSQLVEKERQTNRNSNNSSQPPSSNGPGQPSGKPIATPPRNNAKTSRKSGAQPGHKGHRRALLPTSQADAVHQHYCASYCTCGGSVIHHRKASYRHQVLDVPEVVPYRMDNGKHYILWVTTGDPKEPYFSHNTA